MAYFDIEHTARTDGEFRHTLVTLAIRLTKLYPKARAGGKARTEYQDTLMALIKHCRFNLGYLLPYFWPKYPKNEPLSIANHSFAFNLFSFFIGGFLLIKGSRQISKSTSLAARTIMLSHLIPGYKTMYVTPRSDQLGTYANKLQEMYRAYRFYSEDSKLRKNLYLKEFPNQASIELANVFTSASAVRGKTADEMDYDEYQDFDPDLELEVDQVQQASQMKVTLYAGTSLTIESALEQRWNESSQGIRVFRCGCGHYNVPTEEGRVLDMIQPIGPCCVKCGKLLNLYKGVFVHANQEAYSKNKIGLHIPQMIVPSVVYDERRWTEIYERKTRNTNMAKFLQEIVGIATQEGEREITKQHLMAICTLGSSLSRLLELAVRRQYMFIVSGCDWGGADHVPRFKIKKSTTVHAIGGVKANGRIDILHLRRYEGMGYDSIANDIIHNHKLYRGNMICSDYGVGAFYNTKLREHLPQDRHLIFGYVGPTSPLISEPKEEGHLFNQWSLNKTESLSITFEAIRNGRFQCFDWNLASPYLLDCLNVFRAPMESAAGGSTFVYRGSNSAPNDTLMSLNYLHMGAKILLREPMFKDVHTRARLDRILSASGGRSGGSGADLVVSG